MADSLVFTNTNRRLQHWKIYFSHRHINKFDILVYMYLTKFEYLVVKWVTDWFIEVRCI
jgi:hypothetical protein